MLGSVPAFEGARGIAPPTTRVELSDLLSLMYPWRVVLAESLRQGTLPFWNSHSYVGSPFLANPISAVFYPPNWLFAFLPVWLGWSIQFPLRLLLSVFFAALLARRLGASPGGALLSGCTFGLCGFMTGWQGWPQADVMVWTPSGLLAVLELRRRPGPTAAVLLSSSLAMTLLAGHPEVSLYAVCAIAAFGAWNLVAAWRRGRGGRWAARYGSWLVAAFALAVGLCAVQLVPTAEWLPRITRGFGFTWPPRPSRDWIALLSRDTQVRPVAIGLQFPEECCYVGIGTLLLAPLAFLRRNRGQAVFFAIAGVVSFAVAFGWPPLSQVFRAIPVFRAMPGTRLVGITDLSLAILAGLGFSTIQEIRRPSSKAGAATVCLWLTAGGIALTLRILQKGEPGPFTPGLLIRPAFGLVVLVATLVTLQATLWSMHRSSRWLAACACLIVLDLVTFSWRHVTLVPLAAVFPRSPAMDFLKAHVTSGDRVVFLDNTAFRNVEIPYGLDALDGYPQVLRETAQMLIPLTQGTAGDEPLRQIATGGVLAGDRSRSLLDLLGVRFLITSTHTQSSDRLARLGELFPLKFSAGGVRIYENPMARPRVFSPEPWCSVGGLDLRASSVSGVADCQRPATLVVAQTFYPGWRATVSGRPVTVRATREGLCAVAVPAGTSAFRLWFQPTGIEVASVVSGASLLTVLGLLFACLRGSRFRAQSAATGFPARA